jgi:hypothetical protein
MIVTPFQRANLVNTLRSALDAKNLQSVSILADESNRLAFFVPEAPIWLPSAASSIGAVAHHNYGFDADILEAGLGVEARGLSGGKDTWFTEICCYIPQDSSDASNPTTQLVYGQGYE